MSLRSLKVRILQMASLTAAFLVAAGYGLAPQASATCTPPPTTYGQVTQSVNVASAGVYRVWSRIKASSASNNSYYFQIDNGCAIVVGDSTSIPAGAWTWINYRDANTSSFIDLTIAAGTHQLTYTGREADVQLDRVLLLGDLNCIPDNATKGDNCANVDQTPPTISMTAPVSNATVTQGTPLPIRVTAQDNVAVNHVDFLVDNAVVGTLQGTANTSYTYNWATTTALVGTHSITAKAYDAAGNSATSAPAVTVSVTSSGGGDTQPPTITAFSVTPISVQTGNSVTAAASATDNVGVTRVDFSVDGTVVNSDSTAPYSYTWSPTAVGTHSVVATAYDAAGNHTVSNAANLTVTSQTALPGDITGGPGGTPDGRVNTSDYTALNSHMGQSWAPGNLDGDPIVSTADLSILLAHWTW